MAGLQWLALKRQALHYSSTQQRATVEERILQFVAVL
jgi:hypothetical protein